LTLTPEQQGLLIALAQETGKPIPTLLAEALNALQAHVQATQIPQQSNGEQGHHTSLQSKNSKPA
jgi:hypothetical protein